MMLQVNFMSAQMLSAQSGKLAAQGFYQYQFSIVVNLQSTANTVIIRVCHS